MVGEDRLGILKHLNKDGAFDRETFYLSPIWKLLPRLESVGNYHRFTRSVFDYCQEKLAKMNLV